MIGSSFKVSYTTGSTFHESKIGNIWSKEYLQWEQVQSRYSDYKFPRLDESLYKETPEDVNKPIVIQDMKWSCDGTSIVSVSNDTGIRQYLIPEQDDSLESQEEEDEETEKDIRLLTPFMRKFKNKSIVCSEIHPLNTMYDENYNFILLSSRDMPIQMYNISSDNERTSSVRFSYEITNLENEKYEHPYCMKVFPGQYDQFYTGGDGNKIKIYDMNYNEPIGEYRARKRGSNRSIISCFEDRSSHYVMNPHVILWANYRNAIGQLDTRCGVSQDSNSMIMKYGVNTQNQMGKGIYQMIRSDNDHYLYVLSRQSGTMQVFDLRSGIWEPMNSVNLPYRIGYQKRMATIDEDLGMIIGSGEDKLLVWEKSFIESGGISRRTESPGDGATTARSMMSSFETISLEATPNNTHSRIHIVSRNPSRDANNSNILAIATSSDRNTLDEAQPPQSSLSILSLT